MKAAQRKYKPHVEDPEGDIKRRLKKVKEQEVLRNGVGMVGADVIGLMQRRQLMLDKAEAGESFALLLPDGCSGQMADDDLLSFGWASTSDVQDRLIGSWFCYNSRM
jgi:hypothetical protein